MESISESEAMQAETVAPEPAVELVESKAELAPEVVESNPVAIEPQAAKVVETVEAVASDESSESSDEPEKLNDWEPENPFAGLGKELVHIRIGIYGILTVLLAHSAVSLFKQM